MTETLRKEIHARHIAFLDRMKQKSANIPQKPEATANKTTELFTMNAETVGALRPRWKRHALEICVKRGVMFEEIIAENRSPPIVLVRQEICWHMARNLKMSLNQIGELLKRDNTTIMHSVRRHQKVLDDASKQV
jgi:hypothetical protein